MITFLVEDYVAGMHILYPSLLTLETIFSLNKPDRAALPIPMYIISVNHGWLVIPGGFNHIFLPTNDVFAPEGRDGLYFKEICSDTIPDIILNGL